jgi:hypothetical protein
VIDWEPPFLLSPIDMLRPMPNLVTGRDPKEVAKKLDTVSDAVTSFSVLQAIAYSLALGNKDFHDSVCRAPHLLIPLASLVASIGYATLVLRCHQGDDDLLGKPSTDSFPDKWTRQVRIFRFIAIAAAEALLQFGTYLAYK